jgi:hypothetical protein
MSSQQHRRHKYEDCGLGGLGINVKPYLKNKQSKKSWEVSPVVEYLPASTGPCVQTPVHQNNNNNNNYNNYKKEVTCAAVLEFQHQFCLPFTGYTTHSKVRKNTALSQQGTCFTLLSQLQV